MGLEAKAYYRFQYLRSEHWQNLRIAKLASVDAKCFYCWKRDLSNDVHHLIYKNWRDATLDDLLVLCRDCHQLYHKALEEFKEQINSCPTGPERAVRTIKLLRISRGQTPKISDHFKELSRRSNNQIDKPKKPETPKPENKPEKKKVFPNGLCTLCRSEKAITIIFFNHDDTEKRSRVCLSCYTVYLNLRHDIKVLFIYGRRRFRLKIPLLEWKKN